KADQRRDIERMKRHALMRAGEDAPTHRAAIVVELHFKESRADARHRARTLLRRARETPRPRAPAEQSQADQAERQRDRDLAAQADKSGQRQRSDAAQRPRDSGDLARIELGKSVERPERQDQDDEAEKQRHDYLNCCSSLAVAAPERREASASARIPPAA